jgi:FtsP/CotA-like multicopper oxidase with cupredoxin domain
MLRKQECLKRMGECDPLARMRLIRDMKKYFPITTAMLLALLQVAGVGQAAAQTSVQPAGWDANVRLHKAADLNPDPRVVEVNLDARVAEVEIAPGRRVEAWTYDGGLPGPLIRVRVGDRLVVHFSNHLPKPTTIHWHGLRIPIQMDGVPDHSQPDVQPGESFTYDFIVPDAGLFWYHPHVMSAEQVGYGLYGALLVDDPEDKVGVTDEVVMVLSDIALEEGGAIEPSDTGGYLGMVFGREGNHVLLNGREHPTLSVRSGAPQRWRIVNASKTRYFHLMTEDTQTYHVIGVDGGLLEYPVDKETLLIMPGQRLDVIFTPKAAPGSEMLLRTYPYNRGWGTADYRSAEDVLTLAVADLPALPPRELPRVSRTIVPLDQTGATNVKIDLTLDDVGYGINGVRGAKIKPIVAALGETQIWTVTNKTKWAHPFHLHGFFFQVLDEDAKPVRPLAWRDTVDVNFDSTLKLIVKFDDRAGSWMYHCHILDHADGGMMGVVELGNPDTSGTTHHALH